MYYIIGIILICLGICGILRPALMTQQVSYLFYGFTSIMLAIFADDRWHATFVFHYFFYVVSALIMVLIPILLIMLALLAMLDKQTQYRKRNKMSRGLQFLIGLSFLIFVGYTFWAIQSNTNFLYARFVSVYTDIGIYFTLSFLVYVGLTWLIHLIPKIRAYKVIVILGTEIGDEGEILRTLQLRLDQAIKYYYQLSEQGQTQLRFVVTGGATHGIKLTEADQMKAYLVANGIPASQVWTELLAKNTYENFVYSKLLIGRHGYHTKPLVISSKFHLLRAKHLAYMTHFKADFKGARVPWYLWPYSIVREYLAFLHLTKELNYIFLLMILISGMIQILNR